jgi:hypothetical protein
MSDIDNTGFKTLNEPSQPFNFEEIISGAIIDAIWNGDIRSWKSAMGAFGDRELAPKKGRDFTPDEIYIWVNQNPGEIEYYTGHRHTEYFRKNYSHNAKRYIDVLKAIVNGRKMVLDKYKDAKEVTQSEIHALEKKFKLPDDVRDWLNEHKQTLTEDEKRLFNIQSAGAGSGTGSSAEATAGSGSSAEATTGTSADAGSSAETTGAGGRRRRKTSFRRRRMSRCRSSKSKSKSKKSRKSRKCVR